MADERSGMDRGEWLESERIVEIFDKGREE